MKQIGKPRLKVVPEELFLCKCLHELDLGYNELTTIPSEIAELRQLRVLKLNNNLITDIPTEISYLQELTHLDLRFVLLLYAIILDYMLTSLNKHAVITV